MKNFLSWSAVLAGLAAAVLTGCIGGSVDAAHRTSAKRIGVISLLGDEAQGHLAGLPAVLFARSGRAGSSSDFGVDATASADAVRSLQAAYPGSTVVGLQAERDNVRLPEAPRPGLLNGPFEAYRQAMTDAARQLAARHSLNLVVMIAPVAGASGQAGQTPSEPGYGIWTLSLFGANVGDVSVFANFAVVAFDSGGQRLAIKIAHENTKVDHVPQRSSLDAYSPDQRERLASAIRRIVLKGTDTQLRHMDMVP